MTRPQHLDLSSKLTHLAFHPRSLPTEKPQTSHVTPARDQTGHGEQLLGSALYERLVLGDDNRVLTGTLVDYVTPAGPEVPEVEMAHYESPSPHTLGG